MASGRELGVWECLQGYGALETGVSEWATGEKPKSRVGFVIPVPTDDATFARNSVFIEV